MQVDLSCQKCLKLLENATTLDPCGHTFCFSCVNSSENINCPKCNERMTGCFKNKPIEANDPKVLEIVIRTAFNQRRKTLRNSLKTLLRESKDASSVDLSLRPEALSLKDYVEISNSLTGN